MSRKVFVGGVCAIAIWAMAGAIRGETTQATPWTPATGETIVVNTVEDSVDFAQPQTVAQLPGPDGRISFREALLAANNTAGPQTITFAIPQGEWWLFTDIALLRQEEGIFNVADDGTTIDFTTQTGFTGDTNPDGNEVGIYGLEPNGWGSTAIVVNANNCVIRGLDTVLQRGYGVQLRGNNNRVIGCTISGPLYAGVYISGGFGSPPATGNIVGGTGPNEGNVLSAGNSGVRIDGPAADNVVVGNVLSGSFFGAEVRSAPSSNLFATNNRIGGPMAAERNLISGAGHYGEEGFPVGGQVSLQDAVGTIVQGNYIGTNAAGTASFGQRGPVGVDVRTSPGTQVLDNLISGILVIGTNHYAGQRFGTGISLKGNNDGTVIQGNLIGTDATGQNAVPNRQGIATSFWPGGAAGSGAVTIGGRSAGDGNRIAFNETLGVAVDFNARGITISGNSIDGNGGLGIDLFSDAGAGPTANDPGDGDEGGNGLQNYPVIQSATVSGGSTLVSGTFNSLPNAQFRLEFFASAQCDPSGFGEGATFLGSTTVTTDASGNSSFQAAVAAAAVGSSITATATHLTSGNTSEFSACQFATGSAAPPLQLVSAVSRKQHGAAGTFDLNLPMSGPSGVECRSSGGTHTIIFTFNNNVMSGGVKIDSGIASPGAAIFSGHTMTVTLSNVADAQMVMMRFAGVVDEFGQTLAEGISVPIGFLFGDTNGSRSVSAADVSQVKAESGQPVTASNFRADVTANGAINAADLGAVKAQSGAVLPP
jgi:hypothetical protein